MNPADGLGALLRHPGIWRGDSLEEAAPPGVPTGFAGLDALLPGGGWPRGTVAEILVEREGTGELSLLLPALARLSSGTDRWVALVAPPWLPYAPALAAGGVDLARLLVVRTGSGDDALWAMEQALRSGACSAVLAWPRSPGEKALRRLQLAAGSGDCWGACFTPARAAAGQSPLPLRLKVSGAAGRTLVQVVKRRGGGWAAPLVLDTAAGPG